MKTGLKSIIRLLSIADRQGKLDEGLKNLPSVGLSAVKTSAYYRIEKANRLTAEADAMREEALAEFANGLLRENGDGWTEKEIKAAFESVI